MTVKIILTISYLLVILGSSGMFLFSTKFSFSTAVWQLEHAPEHLCGLNGHQVWKLSWGAIILGSVGQLIACWV